MNTDLSKKMIALADERNLPPDHELRVRAAEFDQACLATPPDGKKVLGCWARARRAWCNATGEPLL